MVRRQLSFYVAAVDVQVKAPKDNPTIGLLFCKSKNKVVAEHALRNTKGPIGVAEYQLVEALPKDLKANLPSVGRSRLIGACPWTGANATASARVPPARGQRTEAPKADADNVPKGLRDGQPTLPTPRATRSLVGAED